MGIVILEEFQVVIKGSFFVQVTLYVTLQPKGSNVTFLKIVITFLLM